MYFLGRWICRIWQNHFRLEQLIIELSLQFLLCFVMFPNKWKTIKFLLSHLRTAGGFLGRVFISEQKFARMNGYSRLGATSIRLLFNFSLIWLECSLVLSFGYCALCSSSVFYRPGQAIFFSNQTIKAFCKPAPGVSSI